MQANELLERLNQHVSKMQVIIDTQESLQECHYVNDPYWQGLIAEEKKLRKAYKDAWNQEYNQKTIANTGLEVGDKVVYFAPSWILGGTWYKGVIVLYRGKIKVRVDQPIEGKRYFQVNKGWKKVKIEEGL